MIERRSSGSSRVDRAVESTISQNRTVICRRSASIVANESLAAGGAAGSVSPLRSRSTAIASSSRRRIADQRNAEILQIFDSQLGKQVGIDPVFTECRLVPLQPESSEPIRDIHVRTPRSLAVFAGLAGIRLSLSQSPKGAEVNARKLDCRPRPRVQSF
jgi:hypothetical protein